MSCQGLLSNGDPETVSELGTRSIGCRRVKTVIIWYGRNGRKIWSVPSLHHFLPNTCIRCHQDTWRACPDIRDSDEMKCRLVFGSRLVVALSRMGNSVRTSCMHGRMERNIPHGRPCVSCWWHRVEHKETAPRFQKHDRRAVPSTYRVYLSAADVSRSQLAHRFPDRRSTLGAGMDAWRDTRHGRLLGVHGSIIR